MLIHDCFSNSTSNNKNHASIKAPREGDAPEGGDAPERGSASAPSAWACSNWAVALTQLGRWPEVYVYVMCILD